MRKVLKCRDLGVACDFSAEGETDEDVLKKMKVHAQEDHNISWSKELEAEWKKAIHIVDLREEFALDWAKIVEAEMRNTLQTFP